MASSTTGPGLFHGAFTAIVTPFAADGNEVDLERLTEQVRFQAEGGVAGVVPCGTTGESPTLSEQEHHRVVETTIEIAQAKGLSVIAGAGSNSTAIAVEKHRFAQKAGADASLQVNPYYNRPSQEGLYRHFMTIADSCDLPIMLYNIPGRTGVRLSLETIERLAQHPNIHAIKDATGSVTDASEISQRTDLAVLSGDDPLTLAMASVGAVGVVSVLSNLVPERVSALCKAFLTNDWTTARAIHRELAPLAGGLLSLDTNPVPVKAAMKQLGRDTGAVRLPLVPPNTLAEQTIHELLREANLLNHEQVMA